jgi:dCMP deaminase
MNRPTWHETWMSIARSIAERSYDPRLKVGAIIVSNDNTRLLALGYNGNYRGGPHEPDSTDPGHSGFIHAEVNALVKCDYNFNRKKIMYLTHSPCIQCSKLIVNANVSEVIYGEEYRDPNGLTILRSSGIIVNRFSDVIFTNNHEEAY